MSQISQAETEAILGGAQSFEKATIRNNPVVLQEAFDIVPPSKEDMIKINRTLYLNELRSGKFKKGCIKSDEKGNPIIKTPEDDDGICACGIIYHLFPKPDGKCTMLNARNSLGITRQDCDYIQYCLNDSPIPFPQIADILERTVFSTVDPMKEDVEVMRAGGECICTTCHRDYDSHPSLPGHNWVTVLCDGRLVKL